MSQRESGYERKERDLYETPGWVTEALLPHIPSRFAEIWEPACASGKMVRVLERQFKVHATDIDQGRDFLLWGSIPLCPAIVTNPPYAHAESFICAALNMVQSRDGFVAMLLRTDFDHAKSRQYLFTGPDFSLAKKLVLTKRIQWFEDSKGSPSFNHAWFIWDWTHEGPPTLAYGPVSFGL